MGQFVKGKPKLPNAGRKAGTLNTLTKTVKERVLEVFTELQEDPVANMKTWAKGEPTEFYKIAAKLIPAEINAAIVITKVGKDLEDEKYV